MRYTMAITISFVLIALISFPAYTQPRIPQEEIPESTPSGVNKQIEKLYSSDALERGRAAHRLGEMGGRAVPAVPFLIEILGDKTKLQWQKQWSGVNFPGLATSPGREAAKALGEIGEPAVKKLIEALKNEDPTVRKRAAEALMKIDDVRAIKSFTAALKDKDLGVRVRAAIGLSRAGHTHAVELETLIAGLKDENEFYIPWHIPFLAAEALGKLGDPRAVEPLAIAFNDGGSIDLRVKIAEALGKIGGPRAVEPLIEALKDEQSGVRMQAAEALGKIGDDRAVEPLIKALSDEWTGVRMQAAEALGEIGDDRAVEPLIVVFNEDSGVRLWAADALWSIGDVRAVEPFIKALKDQDAAVRTRARFALKDITGQNFDGDQLKWREWWDEKKDEMLKDR